MGDILEHSKTGKQTDKKLYCFTRKIAQTKRPEHILATARITGTGMYHCRKNDF